jgi:isopentenyl diphosphate isomerase/L-lactate dehydrogenase-like FMN-dependent dehydrogenase
MAAFGQAGVEKVLEILRAELQVAMQLHGVQSLADLDGSFVVSGQ